MSMTMTTVQRMHNNFHFDGIFAMVMSELKSIWAVAFAAIAEMLGVCWAFGVPESMIQEMSVWVLIDNRDDPHAGIDSNGDWVGVKPQLMKAEAAFERVLQVIRQKDCDCTVMIWTGNRRTLVAHRCEETVKFEINRF